VLPGRSEITQQHDYIHGVPRCHRRRLRRADDVSSGHRDVTVEFKINLLAPAAGDHIEAVGTVVKAGRSVTVCQLGFAKEGRSDHSWPRVNKPHLPTGTTVIVIDAPSLLSFQAFWNQGVEWGWSGLKSRTNEGKHSTAPCGRTVRKIASKNRFEER